MHKHRVMEYRQLKDSSRLDLLQLLTTINVLIELAAKQSVYINTIP